MTHRPPSPSRPDQGDRDGDLCTASTEPAFPAVRPESLPPELEQQRQAWLPPERVAAPPVGDRPPVSQRSSSYALLRDVAIQSDSDYGDRETVLSRDTIVSDAPPIGVERNRALLLRLDGPDAGQVVSLTGASLDIGRHPSTELTINDRGVSRVHARFHVQAGRHWVEDLRSSNGTFVQGERVDHCALHDGDVIQMGPRVSFRFALSDQRQEDLLKQMHRSSTRDALTGVYNRQHFLERLASEIAFAARHHTSVAVVIADIDHFKRVNDTHGHIVGDGVLCHVAGTMNQRMRTEDVFARYGGEEFVATLRGADLRAAHKMAERMRVAISTSPAFVQGKSIPVTISAGCAALGCSPEATTEAMLSVADRRLYVAKNTGRNRVVSTD